jgi:hypothetical protein
MRIALSGTKASCSSSIVNSAPQLVQVNLDTESNLKNKNKTLSEFYGV